MHYSQIIKAARLIIFTALFIACNNPGNNGNGPTPSAGSWKVSFFFDKQDETADFNGYVFEFGSNGSLTATKGGQSWSGTWSTGIDDSADKFLMDFSGASPSPLDELEEDWLIISMDDNLMHLEHTSGGNGDTDVVKFERD